MTVVPLLSDQWLGTGPQPLELRRDRSWYARCADGSRIGFIFAIRQRTHYLDRKQSQGWRTTVAQIPYANVVKALVYLTWSLSSPRFGSNLLPFKSSSNLSTIFQYQTTIWNFIPLYLVFIEFFTVPTFSRLMDIKNLPPLKKRDERLPVLPP